MLQIFKSSAYGVHAQFSVSFHFHAANRDASPHYDAIRESCALEWLCSWPSIFSGQSFICGLQILCKIRHGVGERLPAGRSNTSAYKSPRNGRRFAKMAGFGLVWVKIVNLEVQKPPETGSPIYEGVWGQAAQPHARRLSGLSRLSRCTPTQSDQSEQSTKKRKSENYAFSHLIQQAMRRSKWAQSSGWAAHGVKHGDSRDLCPAAPQNTKTAVPPEEPERRISSPSLDEKNQFFLKPNSFCQSGKTYYSLFSLGPHIKASSRAQSWQPSFATSFSHHSLLLFFAAFFRKKSTQNTRFSCTCFSTTYFSSARPKPLISPQAVPEITPSLH